MSDVMAELHALRAQLRAGEITKDQYDRGFAELNRSVGRPCSICGAVPATLYSRDGTHILCSACALREVRR